MTDNEVIALGGFCERLLRDDAFAELTKQFETQTTDYLFSTSFEDKEKREALYHNMNGVRDFLAMMVHFVEEKQKLTEPQEDTALSDDSDALP